MNDRREGKGAPRSAASQTEVAELASLFHIIGDESRLSILLVCLEKPTRVSEIATRLGLSVSLVSHHLRLLSAVRLVARSRRGREVTYAGQDAHVRDMLKSMLDHLAEEHR